MGLQFAGKVGVVRLEIDEPVAAPVEENDLLFSFCFCLAGDFHDGGNGVVCLRRGDEAFRSRPFHAGVKGINLIVGAGLNEVLLEEMADDGRHAVVTQAARVNRLGHEIVAQREHGEERCRLGDVSEVIGEGSPRHGRAGTGFRGDNLYLLAVDLVPHEGKADPGEVASPARAADDHIGVDTYFRQLFLGLESDDSLVHADVVQNASQRILGVLARNGCLDGLADGDTEASRRVRMLSQDLPSRRCFGAGAGNTVGAPGGHHDPAIGLLLEADTDHENLAFYSKHVAGHTEGASPLTGAGLGAYFLGSRQLVVIGLGHGGIGLVGSRRTHAFILVVDLHGSVQHLLEVAGAAKG